MTKRPPAKQMRQAGIFVLLAALVLTSACGRGTKIYSDPVAPGSPAITGNPGHALPVGLFEQSVNFGSVQVALDNTTATSLALKFQTKAIANSAGSFNGAGVGNRALLGLAAFSAKKMSELGSISFDTKTALGSEALSLIVLLDLNCDGSSVKLLKVSGTELSPGVATAAGYNRMSAEVSDTKWLASTAITDPADNTTVLVPASGAPVSLTALLGKFPNACARNALHADDELPKNTATAAIMISLGTSNTTDANTVYVNRIQVGTEIYEGLEWGSL